MCDYCGCDSFGTIVWSNNIPTITGGCDLDLSDCWVVRGDSVVAWPTRKDGGAIITSRRSNDELAILHIEDFGSELMLLYDKFWIYSSHSRFLVADTVITTVMADWEHANIVIGVTLRVSLYLPDDTVKLFTKMIQKLDDVNAYGIQVSVNVTVERTQESFNGTQDVFLGVGESPLEDKFYNSLPSRIQNVIDAQFPILQYRADFVIESKKLAIEVDGHDYHSSMEQVKRDKERDKLISSQGWHVVRFTGKEIFKDMNQVVRSIDSWLRN